MRAHRNIEWPNYTKADANNSMHIENAQLCVLLDIRDELQTLNAVFRCPRFTGIPRILGDIAKNTLRPTRKTYTKKSK